MKISVYIFLCSLIFISCEKNHEVKIPDTRWDLFESRDAEWLEQSQFAQMQGLFTVTSGSTIFGESIVFKYSFSAVGTDTTFYLSGFSPNDITYFLLQGKRIDSLIVLNGYWRKMVNTETGLARFTIAPDQGGSFILSNDTSLLPAINMNGVFGYGDDIPVHELKFSFLKKVNLTTGFKIMAHRGGGRTSDLLPASENSVEMIRLASLLGADGVEIDVRLTSDGIPVLYHDNTLNQRLIQEVGLNGPISDYNFTQLDALVRLKNGEHIPTLQEALHTVIYETPLTLVWLDTKLEGSLSLLQSIQQQFQREAFLHQRDVQILIGLPDDQVLGNFVQLNNYQNTFSICELDLGKLHQANSLYWAPRWTDGLQNTEVDQMHAESRKVIAWTLDIPLYMQQFLNEGRFDGLLTNYPEALAYYYYAK